MKIEQLNEEVKEIILSNGLRVLVYDNPNLTEYYANYTCLFGSNTLEYTINAEKRELPHGIAHFLEHVMFASPDGDVFNEFAKNAASANAYTNYNQTSYLFSCSDKFIENLRILVKMVQTRYFTPEVVSKEMGIINEEITMYDQMPEWRLRNDVFEQVCEKTNYKIDIAGTCETIANITPELLDEIFDIFYQPSNEVLVLSGDFSKINLKEELEAMQILTADAQNHDVEIIAHKESMNTNEYHESISEMESNNISRASFIYKYDVSDNMEENIKDYFALSIFVNTYFSELNDSYNQALADRKINKSFSANVMAYPDIKVVMFNFNGEDELETSVDFIKKTMKSENIDEKMIKLGLRKLIATEIRALDNKVDLVEGIISCIVDEMELDQYYTLLYDLSVEDVCLRIEKLFANNEAFYHILKK